VDRAFGAFFTKQARYPRFKSKKRDAARFRLPQGISIADGWVVLPSIGPVKIRQSRQPKGTLKSASCKPDATGHWFVTLVEHIAVQPVAQTLATDHAQISGLDCGLTHLIVGSDGLRIAAPRWYRQSERTLRRASRSLSRKKAGQRWPATGSAATGARAPADQQASR
jgi:putative transposase